MFYKHFRILHNSLEFDGLADKMVYCGNKTDGLLLLLVSKNNHLTLILQNTNLYDLVILSHCLLGQKGED